MRDAQSECYILALSPIGQIVPASQKSWLTSLQKQEWLTLPEASVALGVPSLQLYSRRYMVPQYVSQTEDKVWVLHCSVLKDADAVKKLTAVRDLHHSRRPRKVFCVELNCTFRTVGDAAAAVGVSIPTVRMSALHGTTCRAGYTFKYV